MIVHGLQKPAEIIELVVSSNSVLGRIGTQSRIRNRADAHSDLPFAGQIVEGQPIELQILGELWTFIERLGWILAVCD